MSKLQQAFALTLVLLMSLNNSFAAKKYSSRLNLKQFSEATCNDYRGTWEGFAVDPSELFKNGGPWPILVHLYTSDNGRIIGKSTAVEDILPEKEIWARCKKGRIRNIFWGSKGECGHYSQKGILVSKNVLILELHYENAMTGTDFLLLLTRKSNNYPFSVPKEKKDFELGRVKTCH